MWHCMVMGYTAGINFILGRTVSARISGKVSHSKDSVLDRGLWSLILMYPHCLQNELIVMSFSNPSPNNHMVS